jgi:hypothetical protein
MHEWRWRWKKKEGRKEGGREVITRKLEARLPQ